MLNIDCNKHDNQHRLPATWALLCIHGFWTGLAAPAGASIYIYIFLVYNIWQQAGDGVGDSDLGEIILVYAESGRAAQPAMIRNLTSSRLAVPLSRRKNEEAVAKPQPELDHPALDFSMHFGVGRSTCPL
jgi:hypothetical protein